MMHFSIVFYVFLLELLSTVTGQQSYPEVTTTTTVTEECFALGLCFFDNLGQLQQIRSWQHICEDGNTVLYSYNSSDCSGPAQTEDQGTGCTECDAYGMAIAEMYNDSTCTGDALGTLSFGGVAGTCDGCTQMGSFYAKWIEFNCYPEMSETTPEPTEESDKCVAADVCFFESITGQETWSIRTVCENGNRVTYTYSEAECAGDAGTVITGTECVECEHYGVMQADVYSTATCTGDVLGSMSRGGETGVCSEGTVITCTETGALFTDYVDDDCITPNPDGTTSWTVGECSEIDDGVYAKWTAVTCYPMTSMTSSTTSEPEYDSSIGSWKTSLSLFWVVCVINMF